MGHHIKTKIFTDRSHHAEHFNSTSAYNQNLALPNSFGDTCEKLLCDPYSILVTAGMFFNGSKNPHIVLYRIPQGTLKVSLVPIGQVVSGYNITHAKL